MSYLELAVNRTARQRRKRKLVQASRILALFLKGFLLIGIATIFLWNTDNMPKWCETLMKLLLSALPFWTASFIFWQCNSRELER